jgi:hypothetical protein
LTTDVFCIVLQVTGGLGAAAVGWADAGSAEAEASRSDEIKSFFMGEDASRMGAIVGWRLWADHHPFPETSQREFPKISFLTEPPGIDGRGQQASAFFRQRHFAGFDIAAELAEGLRHRALKGDV